MSRALSKDISPLTLLAMRDEEGLSQREIAARIGCGQATVSRMLKGYPVPKKPKTDTASPDPEMDDFFAKPIPPEPSVPAPPPRSRKRCL